MNPSSKNMISSEFSEDDSQVSAQADQPVESITYMNHDLYTAAEQGNISAFNDLQGSQLESLRTPNGNTVLHVFLVAAAQNFGSFDFRLQKGTWKSANNFIGQILNKCPSLLLKPNAKGQTPLHIAARYGHSGLVKFLVKAKAPQGDLEKQEGIEAVREMLRKTDLVSNTALHEAARCGHLQVVKELLEFEDPSFSYPPNLNKETPLYLAARRGFHRLAATILDKCINLTEYGGPCGRTALHAAVMAADEETTRVILEKKRDLNLTKQTDENGRTPLHYAAHFGYCSVVKLLLEWDTSAAYIADKETGMTALLMAARQGNGEIVTEIISYCPDCCEMVDKKTGWNLLHFVAIRHSPRELHLFLDGEIVESELNASIRDLRDEKDIHGNTPLEVYVAAKDHFYVAEPEDHFYYYAKAIISSLTKSSSPLLFSRSNKKELEFYSKNLSTKKREQILKMVEEVIINGEVAGVAVKSVVKLSSILTVFDEARDSHLVVATLVATVAFAAAIAVPGGYNSEIGDKQQGTAILINNLAFKVFVISNALAMVFSLVAVVIHFNMALPRPRAQESFESANLAVAFTHYSILAMMLAFSTGTYAVLKPSSGIAIASCCIGLSFFFFLAMRSALKMIDRALENLLVRIEMHQIKKKTKHFLTKKK
ncbi:hypothetical protein COLO4_15779 [Corchorus olitorius]|uniref:PGG domain-containing protein n=1 Tax=Corchorus olitorius TaxID=93759 RepID=A0A1R3JLB9_9ROSI|nr:hypothetical protein COLO4_15779 [Corchorus olitorius]